MDTKEATIQLVKDLMASDNGLLPYTLYKRYGVTPIKLVQIVKRLQLKGYLQIQTGNRLILTKEGREKAGGFIANMCRISRAKTDSAYFMSIKGYLLDRGNPFLPSKKFFEQLNRKEKGMVSN